VTGGAHQLVIDAPMQSLDPVSHRRLSSVQRPERVSRPAPNWDR
jgi:hypothetical protein